MKKQNRIFGQCNLDGDIELFNSNTGKRVTALKNIKKQILSANKNQPISEHHAAGITLSAKDADESGLWSASLA